MATDDKEDFERISLTDSAYAKVIFHDVKDWYLSNQDLNCTCTVMSSSGPNEGDQIGLYKVGWSVVEDYFAAVPCKVSSDSPSSPSVEISFTFEAVSLPKDDGNYYQFCYTSVNGDIRGGSTPFTFKTSSVDDLFSVEDFENDLLLIQTRTSVLEDSLQKAIKEKTNIQIEKQLLQKTVDVQKSSLVSFEASRKEKDLLIEELKGKITTNEMLSSKNECALKEEISKQQVIINSLQTSFEAVEKEKQDINNQLQNSLACKKNLEETISSLHNQIAVFKRKVASQDAEINSHADVIMNLKANSWTLEKHINEKSKHIKLLEDGMKEHQALNETITSRLVDTEHMLTAMATSKSLAAGELQKHLEKEAELENQIHVVEEKNNFLRGETDQMKLLTSQLKEKLSEALSENESLKDENGLLLKKLENNSHLEFEIQELHRRLALGAEEYKRKYLECHKFQKRVEKLQQKILQFNGNNEKSLDDPSHNAPVDVQNDALVKTARNELQSDCATNAGSNSSVNYSSPSENALPEGNMKLILNVDNSNVPIVTHEQNEKISAEMENQLKKFAVKTNAPSSPEMVTSSLESGASTVATSFSYPYPPYYPYPYPVNTTTTPQPSVTWSHYHNGQYVDSLDTREYDPLTFQSSQLNTFDMLSSYQHPIQNDKSQNSEHDYSSTDDYSYCINNDDNTHIYAGMEEGIRQYDDCHVSCPICSIILPKECDINDHIDSHLYYRCPLCPAQLAKEVCSFDDFDHHVQSHID